MAPRTLAELSAENRKSISFWDEAKAACLKLVVTRVQDVTTDLAAQGAKRAPVREGFLRASVTDYPVVVVGSGNKSMVRGAVGATTKYARVQHENTKFKHPKGGEDHYLTKPLKEKSKAYTKWIAEAVMAGIKAAKARVG